MVHRQRGDVAHRLLVASYVVHATAPLEILQDLRRIAVVGELLRHALQLREQLVDVNVSSSMPMSWRSRNASMTS
jgi:hypothetical protein